MGPGEEWVISSDLISPDNFTLDILWSVINPRCRRTNHADSRHWCTAGPRPGHWLWKNFYSDPDHTAVLQALAIMQQLYALQLRNNVNPVLNKKSEINCDLNFVTRPCRKFELKVRQVLVKFKVFFSIQVNIFVPRIKTFQFLHLKCIKCQ